jgi:hypothetical protein
MAKKYAALPKSPLEMTSVKVCHYLDYQDWSYIVRSLLMYEVERIRQSDEPPEPSTVGP